MEHVVGERLKLFWDSVEKTETCWLWKLAKNEDGYGRVSIKHKQYNAHRISLELHLARPLRDGFRALHESHDICGNRHCVNPAHLREGTMKENMIDRVKDGTSSHGTGSGCAKLTDTQVYDIRADTRPTALVASEYNVALSTIIRIRSRKTWSHLPDNSTK